MTSNRSKEWVDTFNKLKITFWEYNDKNGDFTINWVPIEDFIQSILTEHDEEIIERVEGMNKKYMWCNDGFDPDVPYGKHLSECERHYRMAIDDVINLLKGDK